MKAVNRKTTFKKSEVEFEKRFRSLFYTASFLSNPYRPVANFLEWIISIVNTSEVKDFEELKSWEDINLIFSKPVLIKNL